MSDKTMLTDDVIVSCLADAGCLKERKVALWYETGPYDITKPTAAATNFARAIERAVLAASDDRRDAEAEANARLARAADNIATYLADSPKSALKALTEAVIEHEAAIAAAGNHKVEGE